MIVFANSEKVQNNYGDLPYINQLQLESFAKNFSNRMKGITYELEKAFGKITAVKIWGFEDENCS